MILNSLKSEDLLTSIKCFETQEERIEFFCSGVIFMIFVYREFQKNILKSSLKTKLKERISFPPQVKT